VHPVRSLGEIAEYLDGTASVPLDAVPVIGLSLNASAIQPGELFIALPGTNTHGARFAGAARDRGAAAILTDREGDDVLRQESSVEALAVIVVDNLRSQLGRIASWFYRNPSEQMQVAGITGTNGKTTSTYLLDAALRSTGHVTGLIGTVETRIAEHILPSARTTPEAPELQRLFAEMLEKNVSAVAMEVSSHALTLGRVSGTRFAVSAFTNLSQDHLDFHGSLEEYYLAKASLFEDHYSSSAIISVDDDYGRKLFRECAIPALALSINGPADWWLDQIDMTTSGATARVHSPDGEVVHLRIALPGRFNLSNALVAIACAVNMGLTVEAATAGVGSCHGVPGRMERIDSGQEFLAIVDYAHTPEAVESVLRELRALTNGRIITVLGCGGDRDAGKRPLMGRAAALGSDLAIFTNDNPRSEEPQAILSMMAAGASEVQGATFEIEPDRRSAIAMAIAAASPGDVVLISGKGHEQGQEVAGVVTPFDDRDEVRTALMAVSR
jgi:UDP-N-acetylmuramoyl-L-alanyl-D-glutamate--2,6-diaminopimelate ligase